MSKQSKQGIVRYGSMQNAGKFEESKHPRADDGKFGEGGGGSKDSNKEKKIDYDAMGKFITSDPEYQKLKKIALEAVDKKTKAIKATRHGLIPGHIARAASEANEKRNRRNKELEKIYMEKHHG